MRLIKVHPNINMQYIKTCCLFLQIVFSGIPNLNGQPFGGSLPGYRIIRLDYKNSSGEKASTTFKYNKEGRISKALWALEDKSRYSDNYYNYDSQGNLIAVFREFSDGITSSELFEYNMDGTKKSEHFSRSDSVTGTAKWYYDDRVLKKAVLSNYKGWLSGNLIYAYNNHGQKESAILVKDHKIICHIIYLYDPNKNLAEEFWDFSGKWSQTFSYAYAKTDKKKYYYSSPLITNNSTFRIIHEDYTYNNEVGGPSEYIYGIDGFLQKKVFTRSDSLSTTTGYKYDDSHKLVSSKRLYSNGDSTVFSYTYDKKGNLIQRNAYTNDSILGYECYFYNEDGEPECAYLNNFDNWLTGTVKFKHDFLGKIISGQFKSENGFDASITFFYNNNNLISEILWDFSFGKFQRYNFTYDN